MASTWEDTKLARDCRAIGIPSGVEATLDQGQHVVITQALGGSYTVMSDDGRLWRIDDNEADAIGKDKAAPVAAAASTEPLEKQVMDQLRTCFDPEIPVNI